MAKLIKVNDRARSAWPFLPNEAPADTWWLGPLGERVRVNGDGTADEAGEIPHRRGAASDPCNC